MEEVKVNHKPAALPLRPGDGMNFVNLRYFFLLS